MTSYDPRQAISGLGCAFVVPTLMFGVALTLDGNIPGLQAFAEIIGWGTLCILVAIGVSSLLRRQTGMKIAGLAAAIAFLLLAIWEAHPATPDLVKDVFTTSLRVVALFGVISGAWLILRARRSARAR